MYIQPLHVTYWHASLYGQRWWYGVFLFGRACTFEHRATIAVSFITDHFASPFSYVIWQQHLMFLMFRTVPWILLTFW